MVKSREKNHTIENWKSNPLCLKTLSLIIFIQRIKGTTKKKYQRFKDTKVQRYKDSKVQQFNDTTIQRSKGSKVQRFADTKVQWFKDTKV